MRKKGGQQGREDFSLLFEMFLAGSVLVRLRLIVEGAQLELPFWQPAGGWSLV